MDIDYEAAWLELKSVVLSKRSHGQDGLLAQMARIEVGNAVPEGQRGYDPAPPPRSARRAATGRTRTSTGHA